MYKKLIYLISFVLVLSLVNNTSGEVCKGSILFEWFDGITGNNLDEAVDGRNNNYPDNPDDSDWLSSFEGPQGRGNNYMTRVRGYLYPPTDGDYTFWIYSDDQSRLWLSPDDNPENMKLICELSSCTDTQQWDLYPEQRSIPVTLKGGRGYYIEALHKELDGHDCLGVGWSGPTIGDVPVIIDGMYLSPLKPSLKSNIRNPGFESGNGSPSHWWVSDATDSPDYPLVNWTTDSHSGSRAISLSSPSGEWTSVSQDLSGICVGKVYVFSFWFKSADSRGESEVGIFGTDFWTYVRGPATWTKYTYLVTVNKGTCYLVFHNYHQTGCTFFFDDFLLSDDLSSVIYLHEPNGSIVTSSTPTFRWSCDLAKKYTTYDLVYSKDPNFQDSTTLKVTGLLEANEYTPFEPLADGTWYWKLHLYATTLDFGARGETDSVMSSFTLVSDGQDYRAPEIFSYGPTRMLDTNTPIVVEYADNPGGSGIDPERVTLKIDDRDVRARITATEATFTTRFSQAVHTGEITVYDKAGHSTSKKWWFITKPVPQSGIITFEPERKIFLIDGEPFFPFGMYQFRSDALDDPNPYIAYRSWGFNTTQFYDGSPIGGIKMAGEAGVKCFAMNSFDAGTSNDWNTFNPDIPWEDPTVAPIIAQRIFEGCNLPNMFAWSIRDEPDGSELPRSRLIMLSEFINSLDPFHPTDVVLMRYGAYYAYRDVADLIVGDVYPYNMWQSGPLNGWVIWDEPIHQDAAQGGNTPVITILQHFGGVPGTPWPYEIPNQDRRFMAYLAYIHGSRGLMWYAYHCSSSQFFAPDFPETWGYMKSLAAEFEAMSPVLLSYNAPENVEISVIEPPEHTDPAGNLAIHFIMKTYDGKRYLIAVNAATDETVIVEFRIPDLEMTSVKEICTGNAPSERPLRLTNTKTFSDTFDVFDTHIYEIEIN